MLPNFLEAVVAQRAPQPPQEYGPEFRGWRFEAEARAARRESWLALALLLLIAALAAWAASAPRSEPAPPLSARPPAPRWE